MILKKSQRRQEAMNKWTQIPDDQIIKQTAEALTKNGIETFVVETGTEAKSKVLELIPEGAEILTMTSKTLNEIGIAQVLNDSSKYNSVRNKLNSMDRKAQNREMQRLGAAPEYAIGSAHALSEDGKVLIASNSGSQLAGEVYGSDYVVLVVGAHKIVKDMAEGIERIYEYVLPLESERANKAYNMTAGSFVSKLLIINREIKPGRIKAIIVKEVLGF